MLPTHTAVKVDDPESEHHGATMFIYKNAGDEDQFGDEIPEGWVEVIYKPSNLVIERELFRDENLVICGC